MQALRMLRCFFLCLTEDFDFLLGEGGGHERRPNRSRRNAVHANAFLDELARQTLREVDTGHREREKEEGGQ